MELFIRFFSTEYFSMLFDLASSLVAVGVLIPFAFWAVGMLWSAFVSWVRSF